MSLIVQSEDEYEDLLGLWSDLESGLAMALLHPASAQEFAQRIEQYDHWMQDLLKQDTDVGLYLLFQLAIKSPVGYSASHALMCAVLCDLIAQHLALPRAQRNSLVRAALTMNVAMTELQDLLANQRGRPSFGQQAAIRSHASDAVLMLVDKGITDKLWLKIVKNHHADCSPDDPDPQRSLAHVLQVVDRYAAMISPRQSREGRSATDSAQSIVMGDTNHNHAVGPALVRIVGLYPPGTFVQLDDGEQAVVTRRGSAPDQPDVAIVIDQKGRVIRSPRLHPTAQGQPGISAALAGTEVQERINHHLILQLGARSAP